MLALFADPRHPGLPALEPRPPRSPPVVYGPPITASGDRERPGRLRFVLTRCCRLLCKPCDIRQSWTMAVISDSPEQRLLPNVENLCGDEFVSDALQKCCLSRSSRIRPLTNDHPPAATAFLTAAGGPWERLYVPVGRRGLGTARPVRLRAVLMPQSLTNVPRHLNPGRLFEEVVTAARRRLSRNRQHANQLSTSPPAGS